jgi:hypothetical protein
MHHAMGPRNTISHTENGCGICVCGIRDGVTVRAGQSPPYRDQEESSSLVIHLLLLAKASMPLQMVTSLQGAPTPLPARDLGCDIHRHPPLQLKRPC